MTLNDTLTLAILGAGVLVQVATLIVLYLTLRAVNRYTRAAVDQAGISANIAEGGLQQTELSRKMANAANEQVTHAARAADAANEQAAQTRRMVDAAIAQAERVRADSAEGHGYSFKFARRFARSSALKLLFA